MDRQDNIMAQAPKTTQKKTSAAPAKTTPKRASTTAKKTAPESAASQGVRRVAIIGGNRLPFARSNTAYSKVSNQELLTSSLRGLVDRFGLQGLRMGEVVAGAVIKHSRDFNLTREAVLSSGLAPETPAYDIQQACGTGLEAAILVANKIALGQIECGIAGGADTTSDAPIGVSEGLREILLDLNRARTAGERLKAISRFRPRHLAPSLPENGEPRTGLSMGEHCQITAKEWSIPRDEQDQLAYESHQKLAAAYAEGFFDDLMTPLAGLTRDNILRPDTTLEKLATLKPVFDRENGTLTAANSTALTDGASCVLLASEDWARANNMEIKAYLTFSEVAAVDFVDKKEGLLMAPTYAVPRMLAKAGLTLQDFDFYEIHEAFAAQVLSTLKAWEDPAFCKDRLGLDKALGSIDRNRMNIKGSSLATGHPFAATGGRILATMAKILEQNGSGRGLISICAAGGQGVTAIVER
jgi:acetyl-CoA C-acetyltransferase